MGRKRLVLSGINMVDTGLLTMWQEAVAHAAAYARQHNIELWVLAHSPAQIQPDGFEVRYFPWVKRSWLFRLGIEYLYFPFFAKKINATAWLSMHDMSPHIKSVRTAVYCHNPCMYLERRWSDWRFGFKIAIFSLFYSWLYRINIRRNQLVVVQQQWMRDDFRRRYQLPQCVTLRPTTTLLPIADVPSLENGKIHVFAPLSARCFKNVEYLIAAVVALPKEAQQHLRIHVTISENDNAYARWLHRLAQPIRDSFVWHGQMSRTEVAGMYAATHALAFPSRLETWGLPISEAIQCGKPVLLADLPYAREVARHYTQVVWCDLSNPNHMTQALLDLIEGKPIINPECKPEVPSDLPDWNALFDALLQPNGSV